MRYSRHDFFFLRGTQELQEATASEPLSLEQEYAMQRSWREDADKLTFIACLAPVEGSTSPTDAIVGRTHDKPERMIGDVNLFITENDEDDDDNGDGETRSASVQKPVALIGEVEIMIARKDIHGQGYGRAVLLTFLWYISHMLRAARVGGEADDSTKEDAWRLHLRMLRVKISKDNTRSIGLFESVGFKKVSETPNYFGELELRLLLDRERPEALIHELKLLAGAQWKEPRIVEYKLEQQIF